MGKARLWVHGHVHDSFDYQVSSTQVMCNQRGYVRRGGGMENKRFNPALVIEVDSGVGDAVFRQPDIFDG